MYGAIIGDIAGSKYEFDRGPWTKDFEFFAEGCEFTDDTVLTLAVTDALVDYTEEESLDAIRKRVIDSMRSIGPLYPYSGYGCRFIDWLYAKGAPKPYGSCGNGSAMRVSAAGWVSDSLARTRDVARATAEVTHNHPEGIKGAECTAAVIFLGRNGAAKEEIREYVVREFGYDLTRTVDEWRPLHKHDETCQDSMPKALVSFLEGEDFEDVIRNAVSLGGDTDTIAAIAGAMAEGYFPIPEEIRSRGSAYLDERLQQILSIFETMYRVGK